MFVMLCYQHSPLYASFVVLLVCADLLLSRLCAQEAKKLMEEKFKTGKNRWFFTKLRF